ncbi:hypothetical protein [Sphingobacterium siyangense]|uniref:hypothetical protein n=1 Tax=Sphingobacterium siyangense TaxID=459529 RepID=UPI002FDE0EA7
MILLAQVFSSHTYGWIFIVLGVMVRIIIRRNRFKRRVGYKTYAYKNYLKSELIPVLEMLFNLAAIILIILGILIVIWA